MIPALIVVRWTIEHPCQTINATKNLRYDPSLPLAFQIAAVFSLPIEAIFERDSPAVATRG